MSDMPEPTPSPTRFDAPTAFLYRKFGNPDNETGFGLYSALQLVTMVQNGWLGDAETPFDWTAIQFANRATWLILERDTSTTPPRFTPYRVPLGPEKSYSESFLQMHEQMISILANHTADKPDGKLTAEQVQTLVEEIDGLHCNQCIVQDMNIAGARAAGRL